MNIESCFLKVKLTDIFLVDYFNNYYIAFIKICDLEITKDIKIYIVEDDAVQAELLYDKLLGYNQDYNIEKFSNGTDLLKNFEKKYSNKKYVYLILDYFLQSADNSEPLDGLSIIKQLGEKYPKVKIILFSAYESDGNSSFVKLVGEPNVLEFVKKSIHAFSHIQNILRFDYAQICLYRKKNRLTLALVIFAALVVLSILYFLYNTLT